MKKAKQNKDAVLKARCEPELKDAVDQVAQRQRLDTSDIVRIAVAKYVETFRPIGELANG
jgi:antitoxin component of RelBE/YafQ-DinJ toxin-antitoxin module